MTTTTPVRQRVTKGRKPHRTRLRHQGQRHHDRRELVALYVDDRLHWSVNNPDALEQMDRLYWGMPSVVGTWCMRRCDRIVDRELEAREARNRTCP